MSVAYEPGCGITGPCPDNLLAAAVAAAAAADYAIVCIGEGPSTEIPGDINDLNLSQGQQDLVAAIAETNTPVILVIIEGRPRLLNNAPSLSAAVIDAYLPGPFAGQAMAEILFGVTSPSGRLPFTYPSAPSHTPCSLLAQDLREQWVSSSMGIRKKLLLCPVPVQ